MSKKEMPGTLTMPKIKKSRRSFGQWLSDMVDLCAYGFALVALSVIAVAGMHTLLGGIDEMLINIFSVSFVGLLFYITIKLR